MATPTSQKSALLPTPFSLHIGGASPIDLSVETVSGRESLSKPYALTVLATGAHLGGAEAIGAWIEAPAVLTLATVHGGRRIAGIVGRVTLLGPTGKGDDACTLRLVPRLSRLSLRRNSRIFQEKTPAQIVTEILTEGGIQHRWETTATYPRRAYATQYEETDLAFVQRILAEVGIAYRFDGPAEADGQASETVVFVDAKRYEPIAAPEAVAFRSLAASGGLSGAEEHISAFALGERMAPQSSVRRTFDFRRPRLVLESRTPQTPGTAENTSPNGAQKEWFEHDGEPEPSEHEMGGEDARLEQLRRKARVLAGKSTCRRLLPGYKFRLAGHEIPGLDGEYVVTTVRHDGRAKDQATGRPVYENTFSCVPATERWRPARPPRLVRHVIDTATVRRFGCYGENCRMVSLRLLDGGGRRGMGGGSTASRRMRPLRVRNCRALMASQWVASNAITSGSRAL